MAAFPGISRQLSGVSEFAPGNAAILKAVIVQYLPVIMTLSKFTEFLIGLLQNCAKLPNTT